MIKGYRELSLLEVERMNRAKEIEQNLLAWIAEMQEEKIVDQRWLALAKTDLQKGFMCLGRSIARPDGY